MMTDERRVWLVATLKGGVRKTTTAMMSAFALAEQGWDVLVVDADTGTQGVTDWASIHYASPAGPAVGLPFDVIQYSSREGLLVPFVQSQAAKFGADVVIIDVGGEAPDVLRQAARLATLVVSPVGPDQAELGRLDPTRTVVQAVNPDVPHPVLLTRVPVAGQGQSRAAREFLLAGGWDVLDCEVPQNRSLYESIWGGIPADVGAYATVVRELRGRELRAVVASA